ncbi:MAG: magnesium transporter [candidate division Zixibacteria bacterium]|nr:magnesium transporter [candidate division Zixibacteria bacterium]
MKSGVQQESLKMFVFLSEILNRRVIDSEGKIIGQVVDLRVKLGEIFPPVVSVRVRQKGKRKITSFPWRVVASINGNEIKLKQDAESQRVDIDVQEGEILLRDEILDKQVVDTFGAKVERVNDFHLLLAEGQLRVVHVDFGIRGILRRLGWIKYVDALTNWLFAYQIPKKLLSWKYIQPLSHDPRKKALKLNVTHRKLSEIHPPDLADILEELDRHERSYVFKSLDLETQADTLEEADDQTRISLIEELSKERASDILEEMEPDEAVDLLQDLPDEKKQELIKGLEEDKREELEELLEFEEETAGGIMTTDYISCLEADSVEKVMGIFKQSDNPLDNTSYIYVTDEREKLLGVVTLRDLILNSPEVKVGSFMKRDVIKLRVDDSLKQVAEIFTKYKFLTIPVVDQQNRIEGIITLRDGVEAIFPEFGE